MSADRLFGPGRTTPAMADAVSDSAWLAAMLRVEGALADAQGRLDVIPATAAAAIVAACRADRYDVERIGLDAVSSATPVIALVEAIRAEVSAVVAPFVHTGATSQDVIDTSMMLVARAAVDVLLAELARLAAACAGLADRHRATPMAGRTLLQRARPITFGAKAALWLSGVLDGAEALRSIRMHRLAVQLAGPVGTGSGLGGRAGELVALVAADLGLAVAPLPWQPVRGRVAALGAAVAVAAGAAAKIALDVTLLAQTEVAEVAEAEPGSSSAMPHKRNPAHAVQARAAFAGVTAQAGVLLAAVAGEHERAAGAWQSEWPALSECLLLAAGVVARTAESLTGLVVDEARMRSNLGAIDDAELDDLVAAAELVDRALTLHRQVNLEA